MPRLPEPANQLPPHEGTLEVHLLGLVDFGSALGLQEQQIYELGGRDDTSGTLFLCEHPPVISMGRDASRADLLIDDEELERDEIPVVWVARGGGAFVHAPGQLALYLMLPLQRLGLGLGRFRELFERAVVESCHEVKVPAKRQPGEPGVWSRGGLLATFGAGVKSWVTWQGMFLNVAIDPQYLRLSVTNPAGARSTSMQSQRLDPVRLPQIREALIRQISNSFGYVRTDVSTGHPLLKRTTKRVLHHA